MRRLFLPVALAVALLAVRAATADPPRDLRAAVLERLRAALDDPDRGVRYAAVQGLGKAGEPSATIARALEDPAWCVRQEAAWWLRRGGDAALATVEAALSKGSPGARASAAWSLSSSGSKGVEPLRRALGDAEEEVRLEALAAARRMGLPDAAPLAPEVAARIDAASAEERFEAALTLAVLRRGSADRAVPALEAEVRGVSFQADGDAIEGLLLAGPAGESALAKFGDDRRTRDQIESVRRELAWAAERPRTRKPRDAPAAVPPPPRSLPAPSPPNPSLVRALASGSVAARIEAARALGEGRVDAAVLGPASRDGERDVRVAAATALATATGEVVSAALAALADPEWRVQAAGIRALGRHGAAGAEVAPFLGNPVLALSLAARDALAASGAKGAAPTARQVATAHYGALEHAVAVFDALGEAGRDAVPVLAPLLTHADVNVRETAARCLRPIGRAAGEAAPSLASALADSRLCVVSHAALALGRTGVSEPLLVALADPRARVRAYAAFAAGWALGDARGVDQVPFEVRLPVEDAGRSEGTPTAADLDAAAKGPPEALRDLHLRAIWSKDPAIALRAAAALDYVDLDATDSDRAMEVMLPEGMRRGTPIDFDRLRSIIGSSELPACMTYLARARATRPEIESIYGDFHRISRAETLPALYWFERVEEPAVSRHDGSVWMPAGYTKAHLREAARASLGHDPGPAPGSAVRAFLRDFVADPSEELGGPVRWALAEFEPTAADAPLLLVAAVAAGEVVSERDRQPDVWATLRALGRLDDEASLAHLKKVFGEDEGAYADISALVAASALVRRGDADARRWLVEKSRADENALALLLEAAPGLAAGRLAFRLSDPWEAGAAIDRVRELADAVSYLGARIGDDAFLGIEPVVAAKPPGARTLALVAAHVPGCATRRLAARLFEALESADAPPSLDDDVDGAWRKEDADRAAAFLVSADEDRALAMLRKWATTPGDRVRSWALRTLTRLGDRASTPAILAHLRATAPDERDLDYLDGIDRIAGPEVLAFLREVAAEALRGDDDPDEALEALGRLQGWPKHEPLHVSTFPEERQDLVRKALLAGDMAAVRAAYPRPERLADRLPPSAPAWERLGRASLSGDATARAEFWSAMRAGRYRWIHYNVDAEIHTLGRDPSTLPHWLSDLDSNCCRVTDGLDEFVFIDPYEMPDLYRSEVTGVGQALSEKAASWLSRAGRWVWSPLVDRYVPLPE